MKDMIERYIYDVTRRLPEKDREDVKRELGASINDMLPANPSEQDITKTLTELGDPKVLSEKYRDKPRYLISPAMFEIYISVLKLVVLIVAVVCACVGVLISISAESVPEIIGAAVGMAVEGALQAAFWVTLGFALYDHFGSKKPWALSNLPDLPEEEESANISRASSAVGLILSVFFTALFIILITRGEWFLLLVQNSHVIIPFSDAALFRLIPFIFLLGALGVIINAFKLYWARWNVRLCIINILQNVAWVSIMLYILRWPDLLSYDFITFVKSLFENDADILSFIESGGIIWFFSVIFVVGAIIDIVTSIRSTMKAKREISAH